MVAKFRHALCAAFVILTIFHTTESSVFDSIPFVSQAKSLFQVIGGDAKGARETQERFSRTNPAAAVIRSTVEAAKGHHGAARDTWRMTGDNLYNVVKSVPVVGHGIGVGHYAAGKREEGDQIMKDATRSIAVAGGAAVGGILGGPAGGAAGAVAGGAAYDGVVTGIDSAKHGKYKPYGVVSYGTNVVKGEASPGDTFDTGLGIALDAVGGAAGVSKVSGGAEPSSGVKPSRGVKPSGGVKPSRGVKPSGGSKGSSPIESSQRFGADNPNQRPNGIPIKRPRPEDGTPLRRPTNIEPLPKRRATIEELRKIQDWENTYINTAGPESIGQVANIPNMYNCAYCTLGGLKRITVDKIIAQLNSMDIDGPGMAVNIKELRNIFQEAGYESVSIKPFRQVGNLDTYTPTTQHPIGAMLQKSLKTGTTVEYGLGYTHSKGGHVVVLKAWKNFRNGIESRLIDFQKPIDAPGRFLEDYIPSGETFLIELGDEGTRGGGSLSQSGRRKRFVSLSHEAPEPAFRNNRGWIRLNGKTAHG